MLAAARQLLRIVARAAAAIAAALDGAGLSTTRHGAQHWRGHEADRQEQHAKLSGQFREHA